MIRAAFFSPLPPARSGIADYSAALLEALDPLVRLQVFSGGGEAFDPRDFDLAVYQVGNNQFHDFVYETALRHPGVVVMHETNLHHLICDISVKRGDWEGYIAECAYNGGPAARARACQVRRGEIAPDYEGLKMTRRLLETARAVVVHSQFAAGEIRAAGFAGPLAVIPHGAWVPVANRNAYRHKLGLGENAALAGIFGFLKPYKRIPEALRAFRRFTRIMPEARLILVGEPHPDLPLDALIRSLDLSAHVRALGFSDPPDFVGYLAACDVALNLRYPTAGESSGTLLRALGLGKPALVSDVGAFRELPDDVCAKVPVDAAEEDTIFDYLNLLASRPDVARALGVRARAYVERECAWPVVARRYSEFLECVLSADRQGPPLNWGPEARGREPEDRLPASPLVDGPHPRESGAAPAAEPAVPQSPTAPGETGQDGLSPAPGPHPSTVDDPIPYLRTWATTEDSRRYLELHQTRLAKTLAMVPPGCPDDRILEMGAYLQITPALRSRLGYGEVRGCYYGKQGRVDHREEVSLAGERFACEIDHFDAEKDIFPYPAGHFSTVLCCELIEHLFEDPMHLMLEANRILKPGGHLLLTTPNAAGLRSIERGAARIPPRFLSGLHAPGQTRRRGRAQA